jgi:folylpolyglutamate synthase/dihydropteroate synthase
VIGLLKDKTIEEIIRVLPKDVEVVFAVPAPTHRTLPGAELATMMKNEGVHAIECDTLEQGMELAFNSADETQVICITGSHYVVGKAMSVIKDLTK